MDIESRVRRAVFDRAAEVDPVQVDWVVLGPVLRLRAEQRQARQIRRWTIAALAAAIVAAASVVVWF